MSTKKIYIKKYEDHGDHYYIYYLDSKMKTIHREDGPACEYYNGDKFWYLNGRFFTEEVFQGDSHSFYYGRQIYLFKKGHLFIRNHF